jgi:hypothetical protein
MLGTSRGVEVCGLGLLRILFDPVERWVEQQEDGSSEAGLSQCQSWVSYAATASSMCRTGRSKFRELQPGR